MKSALTSKVESAELKVLDTLTFEAPKTKEMAAVLKNLEVGKKTLIVLAEKDEAVIKSANNLPNVQTTLVNTLNVYDILNNDSFIMTEAAVRKVEEVYA
jgi:large subunit ribosomal protein L4